MSSCTYRVSDSYDLDEFYKINMSNLHKLATKKIIIIWFVKQHGDMCGSYWPYKKHWFLDILFSLYLFLKRKKAWFKWSTVNLTLNHCKLMGTKKTNPVNLWCEPNACKSAVNISITISDCCIPGGSCKNNRVGASTDSQHAICNWLRQRISFAIQSELIWTKQLTNILNEMNIS